MGYAHRLGLVTYLGRFYGNQGSARQACGVRPRGRPAGGYGAHFEGGLKPRCPFQAHESYQEADHRDSQGLPQRRHH